MNHLEVYTRPARLSDLEEIQKMFVDTITAICKHDYSPEQIEVWTSSIENLQRWIDKLTTQFFIVAEFENKIVGFSSLENQDYLDFLYVHRDYQRHGIANTLYSEIEKEAIKRKATFLTADVSKTAKSFFEKKGFISIRLQTNIIKNVTIENFKMSKILVDQL